MFKKELAADINEVSVFPVNENKFPATSVERDDM